MIDVTYDPDAVARFLQGTAREQLPFALALALNRTAEEGQLGVQGSLDRNFTINASRRLFFRRLIKFDRAMRATKATPEARVDVVGPAQSPGRRSILFRHEDGGTATASDPTQPFYLPADVLRPDDHALPPRYLYPSALGLHEVLDVSGARVRHGRSLRSREGALLVSSKRGKRGGKAGKKGGRVFFTVPIGNPKGRTPGIYERTGKDRTDIQLLWMYQTRVRINRRLAFERQVRAIADARFALNFGGFLDFAIRTAK